MDQHTELTAQTEAQAKAHAGDSLERVLLRGAKLRLDAAMRDLADELASVGFPFGLAGAPFPPGAAVHSG
jgi:hypothetical protein